MDIVELYGCLSRDTRLQKTWERNQPRVDRSLEAPLIVRTPREVATAALLVVKLRFEPQAHTHLLATRDADLIAFARSQKPGGSRLANLLEGTQADGIARSTAIHSLLFYRDRSAENPLVRLPWSGEALRALALADPGTLVNPSLRVTSPRAVAGVVGVAALLMSDAHALDDESLRAALLAIPGVGPERADAVGVFGLRRTWPITDDYLWKLLLSHGCIPQDAARCTTYQQRQRFFRPHWAALVKSRPSEDPNELAATLYLWADEAARNGHVYSS